MMTKRIRCKISLLVEVPLYHGAGSIEGGQPTVTPAHQAAGARFWWREHPQVWLRALEEEADLLSSSLVTPKVRGGLCFGLLLHSICLCMWPMSHQQPPCVHALCFMWATVLGYIHLGVEHLPGTCVDSGAQSAYKPSPKFQSKSALHILVIPPSTAVVTMALFG